MEGWMKKLASHYENTKNLYPKERLIILFDIDGTILDMRYMIFHTLRSYDQIYHTRFFDDLSLEHINVHENQVEKLLSALKVPEEKRTEVLCFFNTHRWSSSAILESHRPFMGVMEVIRWFQIQPNTFIGLNTGRPEYLRKDTLRSLNKLGEEYKVSFKNDLLQMNPHGWEQLVGNAKAAAVTHFRNAGYRVFAIVDNEPENLEAVAAVDMEKEILLLHANTIFESKRKKLPGRTVSGKVYDITELIQEKSLPQHIQFVWHGVNDEANLRQFIASKVRWAECDVRMDLEGKEIILRHDSFDETPLQEDEEPLILKDVLNSFKLMDKSIKLNLKENGVLIEKTLEILQKSGFEGVQLWFNGKVDVLKEEAFKRLRKTYPAAIIQCPIDLVVPLILSDPDRVRRTLLEYQGWGIDRFSIKWRINRLREILDRLDRMGFKVNLYNVPDLESFLRAVLLMPRSITSDFNFPKWHYFGRGPGEKLQHHEYSLSKLTKIA